MSNPSHPSRRPGDDLLDAALSALDQPLPESRPPRSKDRLPAASNKQAANKPASKVEQQQGDAPSPTLAGLEKIRRPQAGTVCETCPNSVWFASPVEVKCYCRVMYLVTWSSKEALRITACDGVFLGQDSKESPDH